MIKIFLILMLSIAAFTAEAKDLYCHILQNNEVKAKNKVSPVLNQKFLIWKNEIITAYVTEKGNQLYTVEAFLTDYDARIYSQGVLTKPSDELTASLWGRDVMIDVKCRWAE